MPKYTDDFLDKYLEKLKSDILEAGEEANKFTKRVMEALKEDALYANGSFYRNYTPKVYDRTNQIKNALEAVSKFEPLPGSTTKYHFVYGVIAGENDTGWNDFSFASRMSHEIKARSKKTEFTILYNSLHGIHGNKSIQEDSSSSWAVNIIDKEQADYKKLLKNIYMDIFNAKRGR